MNGMKKYLSTAFLSVAMLLTGAAQAMTFPQFDHMETQDRRAYKDFLPQAAETVLRQQGRTDDAITVHQLFNEISPGSVLPLGEGEFEMNLDNQRIRDAKKAIENPDAPRIQVETALALTLNAHGIKMTPDFVKSLIQLAGTFQPKSPPQSK